MNKEKLDQLREVYIRHLKRVCTLKSDDYPWYNGDDDRVQVVADKMMSALERGTANISDSLAFKGACRELGIKHTRKALDAFIEK
jgi:hypothetical protein